jgi:hypothetical protein
MTAIELGWSLIRNHRTIQNDNPNQVNLICSHTLSSEIRRIMNSGMKPQSQSANSPAQTIMNAELAALAEKCDGHDQFANFDNLFRAMIAVPKAAIDKEETKWKRERAKKKRTKKRS